MVAQETFLGWRRIQHSVLVVWPWTLGQHQHYDSNTTSTNERIQLPNERCLCPTSKRIGCFRLGWGRIRCQSSTEPRGRVNRSEYQRSVERVLPRFTQCRFGPRHSAADGSNATRMIGVCWLFGLAVATTGNNVSVGSKGCRLRLHVEEVKIIIHAFWIS